MRLCRMTCGRWLRKNFFAFHLKLYSKSRRKAPIYWPLTTASGSYTLWLYYPGLSGQVLYTSINDFIEPKLKQNWQRRDRVEEQGFSSNPRRRKALRSHASLRAGAHRAVRNTLLKLAPNYKPNHDDGVQITGAPLWPLFPPQAMAEGTQGHLGQAGKGRLRLGASGHELLA